MGRNIGTIPVERIRPILERVIGQHEKEGRLEEEPGGGVRIVCEQIALTTGKNPEAIFKRVYLIRKGVEAYRPKKPIYPEQPASELYVRLLWENDLIWTGRELARNGSGIKWTWPTGQEAYELLMEARVKRPVTHVTFETADTILTGLHMTHLWYTELEDLYFEGLAEAA